MGAWDPVTDRLPDRRSTEVSKNDVYQQVRRWQTSSSRDGHFQHPPFYVPQDRLIRAAMGLDSWVSDIPLVPEFGYPGSATLNHGTTFFGEQELGIEDEPGTITPLTTFGEPGTYKERNPYGTLRVEVDDRRTRVTFNDADILDEEILGLR